MDSNEETVHKRVVINTPNQRSEVMTESVERGPRESGVSTGTIAIIAVLAILAIGVVVYIVSNRNANESADRSSNLQVAGQTKPQPATVIQQPAQAAPVIIQQPAAAQQPPVIIQQPTTPASQSANSRDSVSDSSMLDVATKLLNGEPNMTAVSITISDGNAVLTGSVSSTGAKAKAERLVNGVRGVKSVNNMIVVSGL